MKPMRRPAGPGAKRLEVAASQTNGIPCWEHPAIESSAEFAAVGKYCPPQPIPKKGAAVVDHRKLLRMEEPLPMRLVLTVSRAQSIGEITTVSDATEVISNRQSRVTTPSAVEQSRSMSAALDNAIAISRSEQCNRPMGLSLSSDAMKKLGRAQGTKSTSVTPSDDVNRSRSADCLDSVDSFQSGGNAVFPTAAWNQNNRVSYTRNGMVPSKSDEFVATTTGNRIARPLSGANNVAPDFGPSTSNGLVNSRSLSSAMNSQVAANRNDSHKKGQHAANSMGLCLSPEAMHKLRQSQGVKQSLSGAKALTGMHRSRSAETWDYSDDVHSGVNATFSSVARNQSKKTSFTSSRNSGIFPSKYVVLASGNHKTGLPSDNAASTVDATKRSRIDHSTLVHSRSMCSAMDSHIKARRNDSQENAPSTVGKHMGLSLSANAMNKLHQSKQSVSVVVAPSGMNRSRSAGVWESPAEAPSAMNASFPADVWNEVKKTAIVNGTRHDSCLALPAQGNHMNTLLAHTETSTMGQSNNGSVNETKLVYNRSLGSALPHNCTRVKPPSASDPRQVGLCLSSSAMHKLRQSQDTKQSSTNEVGTYVGMPRSRSADDWVPSNDIHSGVNATFTKATWNQKKRATNASNTSNSNNAIFSKTGSEMGFLCDNEVPPCGNAPQGDRHISEITVQYPQTDGFRDIVIEKKMSVGGYGAAGSMYESKTPCKPNQDISFFPSPTKNYCGIEQDGQDTCSTTVTTFESLDDRSGEDAVVERESKAPIHGCNTTSDFSGLSFVDNDPQRRHDEPASAFTEQENELVRIALARSLEDM